MYIIHAARVHAVGVPGSSRSEGFPSSGGTSRLKSKSPTGSNTPNGLIPATGTGVA